MTETQASDDLPMSAEHRTSAGITAANQSCKEAPIGRQQAANGGCRASDPLDVRKSEQSTEDESRGSCMAPSLTIALEQMNHRLCTSPNNPCIALSDSGGESQQKRNSSSTSPLPASSATSPTCTSPQSRSSTVQSKLLSSKRRASTALCESDHDGEVRQTPKRRSKRLPAKEVELVRTTSQSSGKEAWAPTGTLCDSGRPASAEPGGLNITDPGASLVITNLTLHTVATAPELILLTAIVRNVANILEVSKAQAVQDLLTETLGDVQELENIACQPLGMGMALVTVTSHRASPASSVASSRCEIKRVRSTTTKTCPLSPAASRQPNKIMKPFSGCGTDTSSDDDSGSYVADSSISAGQKRRRTWRSRSTIKDGGSPGVDVRGLSDSGSDDSQDDGIIERRCVAGRRRNRMGAHAGRWNPREDRQLLAYRRKGKSWSWICHKFPQRSESAIRQHVRILERSG